MGNEAATTTEVGTPPAGEDQPGEENPTAPTVNNLNDGSQDDNGDGRSIDSLPKWAQDLITKTRKEAAGHRTKLREVEQQVERQSLDEQQRAIEEAKDEARAEAAKEYNERLKRAEIRSKLAQERIVNPGDKTLNLIDLAKIEVDDDGNVVGLDSAVEALKTEYPSLIQGSSTDPNLGDRPPPPAKQDMNSVIRAAAGRT